VLFTLSPNEDTKIRAEVPHIFKDNTDGSAHEAVLEDRSMVKLVARFSNGAELGAAK
jgi:hypothetical protein